MTALEISVRSYKSGSTVFHSWTGSSAWCVVDTAPRGVVVTRLDEGWSLFDFCFVASAIDRRLPMHPPCVLTGLVRCAAVD